MTCPEWQPIANAHGKTGIVSDGHTYVGQASPDSVGSWSAGPTHGPLTPQPTLWMPLPELLSVERPQLKPASKGHVDPDCEVERGVGWMCTCETPAEKAERQRERDECEAERDAAVVRPQPDLQAIVDRQQTRKDLIRRDLPFDDLRAVQDCDALLAFILKAMPS